MSGSDKSKALLKKENTALKNEVQGLKDQLNRLETELRKREQVLTKDDEDKAVLSPDRAEAVDFVSKQYDDLVAFKAQALKELNEINSRISKISIRCDEVAEYIETMEAYSYQFNIKIVGMSPQAERESPELTTQLCLRLFSALGANDVTIQDIDIHTVFLHVEQQTARRHYL